MQLENLTKLEIYILEFRLNRNQNHCKVVFLLIHGPRQHRLKFYPTILNSLAL